MFAAGVAVLAYGAIDYFGWMEDDSEFSIASLFPRSLKDVDNLPAALPYNQPQADVPTPELIPSPPLRLVIDGISVDAPVETYGLDEDGVPVVPVGDDAGDIVAWYDFSSPPGMGSNSVFAAHVTWNKAPAVFWEIKKLKAGETLVLATQDGREFTYEVFANFPVDPDDPASLKVMAPTETDTVTLITCGGTWVPDASERFGGEYTDRTVVQAKLVQPAVSASAAGG